MVKKYIWELLGVFLFSLLVLQLWHAEATSMIPMGIGMAWLGVQYIQPANGRWYGNPAYLTADLLLDRVPDRRESPYRILAMVLGGILTTPFFVFFLGCSGLTEVEMVHPDAFCAFFVEFLGSFILTLAYLGAASTSRAIQAVLLAALLYAFSGMSGGAFNPALAIAYAFGGRIAWFDLPYYIAANLLGAAAAASLLIGLGENDKPA